MAAPVRGMFAPRMKTFSSRFDGTLCMSKALTWCRIQYLYSRRHLVTTGTDTGGSSVQLNETSSTDHFMMNSTHSVERGLGRTGDEQHWRILMKPDQPPDARILRVAIIGTPNAGKSTLTNRLMRWRVSSVSSKVHTTRKNTLAIHTEGNTQIVFMDTPGLLHPSKRKRHNLDRCLVTDPAQSLQSADIVGVIVDVSNPWTRNALDPVLLETLYLHPGKPSILILNKVDALAKKQMLLQITRGLTEGVVAGEKTDIATKKQKRYNKVDLEEFFQRMNQMDTSSASEVPRSDLNSDNANDLSSDPATDSDVHGSVLGEPSDIENTDPTRSSEGDEFCNRHILPVGWRSDDSRVGNSEDPTWLEYHEKMNAIKRKIEKKKGWAYFDRVFMVSALQGDGVDEVRDYLLSVARPGDWDYHSSVVTDQNPFQLAKMCVWEKLLEYLPKEIPYGMYPEIVIWEVDEDGILNIMMDLYTTKTHHLRLILGKKGGKIQRIAVEAKQELMNAFRCDMRLKLVVKTNKSKR